jgi:hypothetical protein
MTTTCSACPPARRGRPKKILTSSQAAALCGCATVQRFVLAALDHDVGPASVTPTPLGRTRYTWYAADIRKLAPQLARERRDRRVFT